MAESKKAKSVASAGGDVAMGQLVKAGPIGSPVRAGQKRGADVDLGAANAMQRRSLHAIKGVDTEFKDKVNKALSDLELTKEVKVLQFVMDQVTSALGELQKMAHEQGDSLDKHEKHLKNLDVQAVEQDKSVNQVGRDAKGAEKLLEDQLKDLEHEFAKSLKDQTERNEVLHSLLATQESVLIERIEEFKALFVKWTTSSPRWTVQRQPVPPRPQASREHSCL